ncbi:hypothetical protein HAZT_HAZT005009 [Hyalella azteca]|uniref:G-protein coupled receptors family 1 profile domain-containing protein n=1 Tax=Hyalella azteca TaxID=294128 RepID=A0A6A0H4P8_HYAAZ|nr:hypothetical protein HAZT_HAZT005009 [Hyalella azteca]
MHVMSSLEFTNESLTWRQTPSYLVNASKEAAELLEQLTAELYPATTRCVFTTCFCILFIVGLTGNVLVLAVVCRDKELSRSSTGAFITNLALADLLVLAICLPTSVAELQSPPLFWVLPSSLCKAVPFIESLMQHASVLTIFAIALERHHAICRPLSAARACTRRRAAATCCIVWVLAIIVTR